MKGATSSTGNPMSGLRPSNADLLAELVRVQALFQLRAISTVMGIPFNPTDPAALRNREEADLG